MVHASDLAALLEGRHADPFAVLGPHRDAAGTWWIRAWMPGATTVDAIDARSGRTLARLRARGDHGFFEAACPTATVERPDYRLRVQWHHGATTESRDAYAFGPLIAHDDLHALRDGRHPRPYTVLGAHPLRVDDTDGVRFAVWAPNASRVSVVGDFNAWDGRRHPMRVRHDAGVWELFVPHVACGDRYKFEVRTRDGAVLALKADPYAFASELRPATASVVARLPDARPLPSDRAHANSRSAPMSIYEVHLGSWRRAADGGFLSWDTLAQTLPGYVADLGFTHVELLPITEHPFDGSWGYQTLGLYAPTARFGTPDGFARFIDACRAHGLGVLIDWVPAHFPADVHGLAHFDGTALYEYADPREGFHRDWNTLIYHFGRHEVRNFLVGSALYWIERFGIDGLRVDAVASMLYRDYSRPAGEWIPNVHGGRENLEAIAMLKRTNEVIGTEAPGAITVAEESTAFPGVSHPTYAGGLGFHYKWNMGWMHDTLAYMAHDPVHRKWHHDKLTFGLVYAFSENFVLPLSHDEVVHGKGSLIGKMPGDRWQKFANLRAYFGFMWTHPGKKLLFMGGEFAQEREWNHDTALDWALLDRAEHRGVQHLVRDLNRLYASRAALHRRDCDASGFTWVEASDADRSLLAYLRWGDDPRDVVLVVCNFTPVPRHDVTLGVPDVPGARGWREVLNTDAAIYAGSNVGNASGVLPIARHASHGQPCALRLTAPPLATVVLEPSF